VTRVAQARLAGPAARRWQTSRHSQRAPTLVGLCLALGGPPLYVHGVAPLVVHVWPDPVAQGLAGLGVMWLLAGCALVVARTWDRPWRPLFNQRVLSWRGIVLGIGLGVLCGASVPLLGGAARALLADESVATVAGFAANVSALSALLAVATAACTEEVLYRGFAIEVSDRLTGHPWIGAALGLAAFVLQHVGGWSLSHVIGVVLPLGAVYTGLYLWRRSLPLLVLVHFVTDLPLVLLAAGVMRVEP
jgi:membrane protease YdiL (CAAX protease family)